MNRPPFEIEEWYHCFSRGIDRRNVFANEMDANRFLMLLYLANGTKSVYLHNAHKPVPSKMFSVDRGDPIVAVGAYCLMPNHFHLLLKESTEGGITSFMRKVGTAYTMYFNSKNERVGNLFVKPFRSRHIENDRYFQRVIQYIHCNPAELYEKDWKSGKVGNLNRLKNKLISYPYSSFSTFVKSKEVTPIVSAEVFDAANQLSPAQMLEESIAYYAEGGREYLER